MTLQELKAQIQQQIEVKAADVEAMRQALRQAEINLAFLQGQLHGLNQIRIEEQPIYSSSEDGADNAPPV